MVHRSSRLPLTGHVKNIVLGFIKFALSTNIGVIDVSVARGSQLEN